MNNVDYHGAVECEVCNSVYSFENLPEYCSNCGAEMEVSAKPEEVQLAGYERDDFYTQPNEALYHGDFVKRGSAKSMSDHVKGSVTCSWCGTYFAEREDRVNCDSCAGNLPMPPGNDPGPKPPGLPRILPSGYKTKLYITKNISGMNSLFLIVLGLVVPIFILLSLIGLFILVLEIKDKRNRVNVLSKGKAVRGKIEAVQVFGEAKNPENIEMGKSDRGIWCKVYYLFDVDGNMLRGIKTTYDPNVRDFFVEQPVWVVYTENKLKCHSLWPPIT